MTRRAVLFAICLYVGVLLGAAASLLFAALAESAEYAPAVEAAHIPSWLWATIIAGIVQGLVWYGAINTKLTWLMARLDVLEKRFNRHLEGASHRRQDED